MSKVVSMSSGAIDPIAQSKRVFFRPAVTSQTIRVGDCVCYNYDVNTDHKGRSSDPTHLGLRDDTYAEGAQDRTGRLFIVERPDSGNLEFFAGIVKCLGPEDGANGDMIEIFVPNGAVVPVMCDQYCTKNVTVVGIRGGYYEGTYPGVYSSTYDSRPIGIAMETIDRSETDGLCWVKVDPTLFIRQGAYSYRLVIDDEAGSDVVINQTYVTSHQTAGQFLLQRIDGLLDGTGHMQGGMVMIRGKVDAAMSGGIDVVNIGLSLGASTTLYGEGATNYANCALAIGIGTSGTPNLSTGCAENTLCAISINYHVNESGGAPQDAYAFMFHSGTYNWDGLMHIQNSGDLGEAIAAQTAAFGATDMAIPINIGGVTYYIMALVDGGLT